MLYRRAFDCDSFIISFAKLLGIFRVLISLRVFNHIFCAKVLRRGILIAVLVISTVFSLKNSI